jgi:glycosyltransferase involved in cell wall biosynthesis
MNIQELLPPSAEFIDRYNNNIELGKSFLKDKKIVITGLARNIANSIEHSLSKLVNFAQNTKDYKIIIFENDSSDNTREILENIKKDNPNIITLYETHNRPQFGQVQDTERTMALAEYRNTLREYINTHLLDYDYVIVSDMDFIDFSDLGCYNSFGWLARHTDTIDAVAGNSFEYKNVTLANQKSLWNYDSWAFRYTWWNQLPVFDSMTYSGMLWFGFFIMPVGSTIIPVNSAFGGMTIYKTHQFVQGTYDGYDCEHVCFHYSLKQKIPSFQLVLNPSQTMLLDS